MTSFSSAHIQDLKQRAQALRFLTVDAIEAASSGHPGMPLGMADVATVLYHHHVRFSPWVPRWPARDRVVLSAGHGSMLLYSLWHLLGYPDVPLEALKRFRHIDSPCAGHPEYGLLSGVETTTGPLAQGLAHAVGMALAERLSVARYGSSLEHSTYVLCSDGCLMEGLSHEAASFAGHYRLGRLIVMFDDNHITIDGPTSLSGSEDTIQRFRAYGWHVQSIDGHDPEGVHQALLAAQATPDQPSLIACRTTIGWGAPTKAGTAEAHGSPLGAAEVQAMRTQANWLSTPFEVPPSLWEAWRSLGQKAHETYQKWEKSTPDFLKKTLGVTGLSDEAQQALVHVIKTFQDRPRPMATRTASHQVLEVLHPLMPSWIGGSADLTPSNNTQASWARPIQPPEYTGHYLHYGVREHGMAAIMNGLTLHGEFRAFGGTFLAFSDYLRPSLRLSALMHLPVIYVFTHDSIGLGEDGPTHQPIEHLWSLRLIPHVTVYRPADAIETAECWSLAAHDQTGPSVLVLSRQAVPLVRQEVFDRREDFSCGRGGYILRDPPQARCVLIATGSEVSLALQIQALLNEAGWGCRVVSMPCTSLFDAQPLSYLQEVLPSDWPIFALEAGSPLGWVQYTRTREHVFGLESFGLSGPGPQLFKHFGFEPSIIAARIQALLKKVPA